MQRLSSSVFFTAVLVVCMGLLSACGRHDGPASDAPAKASSARPAPRPLITAAARSTPVKSVAQAGFIAANSTATAIQAPPEATNDGQPIAVTKVTLGSALDAKHQVVRPGDEFAPGDTSIYAVVNTRGSSGHASLSARWSYVKGEVQLVNSTSQAIATTGPATTSFEVHNPDLWPTGHYQVEISLDGRLVSTQKFEVAAR